MAVPDDPHGSLPSGHRLPSGLPSFLETGRHPLIAANDVEGFTDLPRGVRLLGLDLGTKTIGLALSDVERRLATPLETIARTKFTADAARLRHLVDRYAVGGLVLGLPVNMDGTEGPRAQATRAFARNLGPAIPLPLAFWDERLSTAAVTRSLIELDASRAQRAKVVDQLAAAYILQGALDRLRARSGAQPDDTTSTPR